MHQTRANAEGGAVTTVMRFLQRLTVNLLNALVVAPLSPERLATDTNGSEAFIGKRLRVGKHPI
jgi:hypothetical protein